MHQRPRLRMLVPVLCALAGGTLAGCGELWENVPPRPEASNDPQVAEADFPRLAGMPARPRLGYALEQRRAIAEGLVADRANARHVGDALRREMDQPVPPDEPPVLPPVPVAAEAAPGDTGAEQADLVQAYVDEALARAEDDGSLGDFLDRLEQPPPGLAESEPGEPAFPPQRASSAPPSEADAADEAVAEEAGVDEKAETADPASTNGMAASPVPAPIPPQAALTAPVPALPLTLAFASGAVEPPAEWRGRLEALARDFADNGRTLVIAGGGERAGAAMERARRVAAILVAAGLAPGRIALEMAGESDDVVVYEANDGTG